MAISILTNVASLNAQGNLSKTQAALAASIGRLSSGQRINSAGDDAAGLGISEALKANLRGLAQAHAQRQRRRVAVAGRRGRHERAAGHRVPHA